MGGGLMQLVAYGAQDIYLTGNPQITFFKVVYRRHTNFSMEAIEQTWNGSVGPRNRITATISRNGDLVHRMYLEQFTGTCANSSTEGSLPKNYGNNIISDVELEIGGQRIDKHSGHWMETWAELTEPNPRGIKGGTEGKTQEALSTTGTGYVQCAFPGPGKGTKYQAMALSGGTYEFKPEHSTSDDSANFGETAGAAPLDTVDSTGDLKDGTTCFIPLQFWFCRNPGLALPLIALQYHEVKVVLTMGNDLGFSDNNTKLFVDYIYLDTDERRRFAQVSHEYLIEQVQEQSLDGESKNDVVLNFNHPVKELIFSAGDKASDMGTGGLGGGNWGLKLNGHERFTPRDVKYFTRAQVWEHHTGYGAVTNPDGIGVYSFALKPEEHQPSGTCNFSRIDNAVITNTDNRKAGVCYAINYNVLRIMSGMGGLAYSN